MRKLLPMFCLFSCSLVYADMSGFIDPRTFAMGGAGVASADNTNAAIYNPALLASYDKPKEKADNSRLLFPVISVRVTNVFSEIDNFGDRDFGNQLSTAVDDYNANPNSGNAQNVVNIASDLRSDLGIVSNQNYIADAYAGFIIGLPGKREGGSFYILRRAYALAAVKLSNADKQTIDDYINGMSIVASGGNAQSAFPQIFGNGGQLLDRTEDFTSNAAARGVDLVESGVAFAGEFSMLGHSYFLGVTPKFQLLTIYDYFENSDSTVTNDNAKSNTKLKMNMDLGLAKDFSEKWRAGLSVINLYPRNVRTNRNNKLRFRPELKAGSAYRYKRLLFSADMELLTTHFFGVGHRSQNISIGTEWSVNRILQLRGGFRQDVNESKIGPLSAGFGLHTKRTQFDLAFAYGPTEIGAALQFGIKF